MGRYECLSAFFFKASITDPGTGKGDWPKPNLQIFFPKFFNLLDSSLIASVAEGFNLFI